MMKPAIYLRMLDDFCLHGHLPQPADAGMADSPWLFRRDALADFLLQVMQSRQPDYHRQVCASRLRGKMFYEVMGRFVADCVHQEQFQHRRMWTERNNIEKTRAWSMGRKANREAVEQLLARVTGQHADDGFDAAFCSRLLDGDGWQQQENWDKVLDDWSKALDRHAQNHLQRYIDGRKAGFLQALQTTMRQVKQYMRVHQVDEDQAMQAMVMIEGQWTETEFERRLKVVRIQDKFPAIGEIVACMGRTADTNGRARLAVAAGSTMRMEHSGGSDIEGITVGNDLGALLPLERAQYGDDSLGSLFVYKYLTQRLQMFRYRSESGHSPRKLGFAHARRQGPMVVCIDTSASMYGTPQRIGASLLSLVEDAAARLGRDCFLIDFSVSAWPIDLMKRRAEKNLQKLGLAPVREKGEVPFLGGGTCAVKLLDTLYGLLDNRGDRYVNADVLWLTDFQIPLPAADYLRRFKAYKQTGTKFYGLRILCSEDKEPNRWEPYFDRIDTITYRPVRKY